MFPLRGFHKTVERCGHHGRPPGQKTELFLRAQGGGRSIFPRVGGGCQRGRKGPQGSSRPHTRLEKTSETRDSPRLATHPGLTLPRVSEGPCLRPDARLLEEPQAEREKTRCTANFGRETVTERQVPRSRRTDPPSEPAEKPTAPPPQAMAPVLEGVLGQCLPPSPSSATQQGQAGHRDPSQEGRAQSSGTRTDAHRSGPGGLHAHGHGQQRRVSHGGEVTRWTLCSLPAVPGH